MTCKDLVMMADYMMKMMARNYSLQWCFMAAVAAPVVPTMPNAAFGQSATPGSVSCS